MEFSPDSSTCIINYLLQSREPARPQKRRASSTSPAASRGGCFAVVLRFRGAAQTCGGIFTINVSSRSCCDPCMSLFSPTSHSRTLERSGFPSFDKCAFSLRNSPRFLQAKKKKTPLTNVSQFSALKPAQQQPARPATFLTRPWNYGISVNGSVISTG